LSTLGVIVFATVATGGLAIVAVLGLPVVAAALAFAVTLAAGILLVRNWAATAGEVAGREGWERKAASIAVCGLAFIVAGVVLLVDRGVLGVGESGSLWLWRALAVDAAVVFSVFYFSSLVDWCYVVPRLRGLGEVTSLPCQSSTLPRWESLTRIWLAHRIGAFLVGRVGGLLAFLLLAVRYHPEMSSSDVSAMATVVAALIVFYLNRLVPIGALVTNPPIQVGDKVVLAEEFGTGVEDRPVYYIVDVAIEGVKLLELDEHDRPLGAGLYRGHDRSLSLADVGRLLRGRQRFEGCSETCCRANRYCPLNRGEPVGVNAAPPSTA
jgi:hypothetical protein